MGRPSPFLKALPLLGAGGGPPATPPLVTPRPVARPCRRVGLPSTCTSALSARLRAGTLLVRSDSIARVPGEGSGRTRVDGLAAASLRLLDPGMDRAWVELIEAAARRPLGVATLFPTSRALARRLVRVVQAAPPGPVLELGAGAGAVTRVLAPAVRGSLTALEVDPVLVRFLAGRFPAVAVRCGAAEDLLRYVDRGSLSAVVSSLPWTVLPTLSRERILTAIRGALRPDGVLVTYLCLHAFAHPGGRSFVSRVRAHLGAVELGAIEWRNVPPARVIVARTLGGAGGPHGPTAPASAGKRAAHQASSSSPAP